MHRIGFGRWTRDTGRRPGRRRSVRRSHAERGLFGTPGAPHSGAPNARAPSGIAVSCPDGTVAALRKAARGDTRSSLPWLPRAAFLSIGARRAARRRGRCGVSSPGRRERPHRRRRRVHPCLFPSLAARVHQRTHRVAGNTCLIANPVPFRRVRGLRLSRPSVPGSPDRVPARYADGRCASGRRISIGFLGM